MSHSSNRSLSVALFETLIVDWFISHVFTCETATEQMADRVTTVGLKMASNLHVNMWEINQSATELGGGLLAKYR